MGPREQFRVWRERAKYKSHREAFVRALIRAFIFAVVFAYPAALWKRIVGGIVAWFLMGVVIQLYAIGRDRSGGDGTQI